MTYLKFLYKNLRREFTLLTILFTIRSPDRQLSMLRPKNLTDLEGSIICPLHNILSDIIWYDITSRLTLVILDLFYRAIKQEMLLPE